MLPVTLVAPGPGRFAFELTVGFDVTATQKDDPSLIDLATPTWSAPAGLPISVTCCTTVPARTQAPGAGQLAAPEQPRPSFAPPLQKFVRVPDRQTMPAPQCATSKPEASRSHGFPLLAPV